MTDIGILDALYEKLTAAAIGGDFVGYSSLFTEKGALMPPGSPAVVGRSNIGEWIERFLGSYELNVKTFAFDDRVIGESVAFCRWTASGIFRHSHGEQFEFNQKYLDTIVKDSDGQWRFAIHMWSPNTKDWGVWARI
jgi:uncharacterized protein (TIGR02246 family)